jgi:hypothetical protein
MRRRRGRKEGVDRQRIVAILAVVALVEMSNPNTLLLIKFCGSNHLIRGYLVGVIPEILKINLIHDLKFRQTMLFLFIVILGHLNGLNKFCYCGQSCK